MTRKKQKENEKRYLELLLKAIDIKPDSVECGEEPPDLYFYHSNNKIAVEVTDFYTLEKGPEGHLRQEVEAEWDKIQKKIDRKKKKYKKLNHVYGKLCFKGLNVPPGKKQDKFVQELIVFAFGKEKTGQIRNESKDYRDFSNYPLLNIYLEKISLIRLDCYGIFWDWNYNAAWIGVNEDELKSTITPKLKNKRPGNIIEYWLLLSCGLGTSQQMGLPKLHIRELKNATSLNLKINRGPFDKIYIYQRKHGSVVSWDKGIGWSIVTPPDFTSEAGNEPTK